MKKYFLDLLPKFKRIDKRLDDITTLVNKHWIDYQEGVDVKVVWIFTETPNVLRISENGVIKKGAWAYLGSGKIELEIDGTAFLFHHEFHDDNLLAFIQDGTDNYKLLVSEKLHSSMVQDAGKIVDYVDEVLKFQTAIVKDGPESIIITSDTTFNPNDFMQLPIEVAKLKDRLEGFPEADKIDMVVYFLSSHSLKSNWKHSNTALFNALSNGDVGLNYFETILNACVTNTEFKNAFLGYIRSNLANK